MYEYQEKQISKIAEAVSRNLSRFNDYIDAPETDPSKIEHAIRTALEITAEAVEPFFNARHMSKTEEYSTIQRVIVACLIRFNVWETGFQDYYTELIEIVKDELAERRRDAIRDSFCDTWNDDPDPETADGYRQQDLIDMYRRER